jgi:hypothetical protein
MARCLNPSAALLNMLNQSITMGGLAPERSENHHLQGTGEQNPGKHRCYFHKALRRNA